MADVKELRFYSSDKQCVSKVMYYERFREAEELYPDTPTMIVASAPTEYCWNSTRWGNPQSIALCYACGRFFITGDQMLSRYYKQKAVYCPFCGRKHPIRNIKSVSSQDVLVPLHISVKIVELKDVVRLSVAYEAQKFTRNPIKERGFKPDITEYFDFNTTKHEVTWTKPDNSTLRIGYSNDYLLFEEKSALSFLNWSTKSQEGPTFSALLKTLRKVINKRMKAQGYTEKKMAIKGGYDTLIMDSICVIAHQVRFWDAPKIDWYGQRISHLGWDNKPVKEGFARWCLESGVDPNNKFESDISRLMQNKNISYIRAFCEVLGLKIPKFAYQFLKYSNAKFMKAFYDKNGVTLGNAYIPFVYDKSIKQLDVFNRFYDTFASHYPNVPAKRFAEFGCSREAEDTLYCLNLLHRETREQVLNNLPKFAELHDLVVRRLNDQREVEREAQRALNNSRIAQGFIQFNIPELWLSKLNRTIGQYTFKVIENSADCSDTGSKLHNCAAGYAYRVAMGITLFLVKVFDGENLIALLELSNESIAQAKLFANKVVSTNEDVNAVVVKYAKLTKMEIATRDVKPELVQEQKVEEKLA